MRRRPLDVEQLHAVVTKALDQRHECNFGGVGLRMEHRFPGKQSVDAYAIDASDEFPAVVQDLGTGCPTEAVQQAVKRNFPFKRLRAGRIKGANIHDERNHKYLDWTADQLVEKIDEKMVELRNIKKMNRGSVHGVKNNIALMMSNLYFRMKLLADFITEKQ